MKTIKLFYINDAYYLEDSDTIFIKQYNYFRIDNTYKNVENIKKFHLIVDENVIFAPISNDTYCIIKLYDDLKFDLLSFNQDRLVTSQDKIDIKNGGTYQFYNNFYILPEHVLPAYITYTLPFIENYLYEQYLIKI